MNHLLSGILVFGLAWWVVVPAAGDETSAVGGQTGHVVFPGVVGGGADPFVPDVHPSRAEAARDLGRRYARAAFAAPAAVTVRIDCASPELFHAFSEGLVSGNPDARPVQGTLSDRRERPPSAEVFVSLASTASRLTVPSGAARPGVSTDTGVLTLMVDGDGPGGSAAPLSVRFVEKPWLSDFAGFVADHRGGRWIVGRTHRVRPAATAADAAREARASAADEVLRLVNARVPEHVRRDDGRLRATVEAKLVGGDDRMVVDRFPQTFDRGYGAVYREAVLIDASDAKLSPLVAEVEWSARERRESRFRTLASAAAVLLVTYALYRLTNAFTRGYFTWWLRTAAAVVAAGAVTILTAVA